MVFLGTALGLLSDRKRPARRRAEALNLQRAERQVSLERAYQNLTEAQERLLQSERLATVGKLAAPRASSLQPLLTSCQCPPVFETLLARAPIQTYRVTLGR